MLGLGAVVLQVHQAAFVKTGSSCVVIVVYRCFQKPPDTMWPSGLLLLPISCMGGADSVWVVVIHTRGTQWRYCAGRSSSFAFILPSLQTVESHQHGRDRPVSRAFVSLSPLVIITSSSQSPQPLSTSKTHPSAARGNSSSSAPARASDPANWDQTAHEAQRRGCGSDQPHYWRLARSELSTVFQYTSESVAWRVHLEIAFVQAGLRELKAERLSGGTAPLQWATDHMSLAQTSGRDLVAAVTNRQELAQLGLDSAS